MATAGMKLDALASLQADELRKLIKSLQRLAASMQEGTTPKRHPPVHTSTTAEEEEIRWEQMVAGRLPVTEDPHTRPPPTHDPISTQTLAGENTTSYSRPSPQVATFSEVFSQQQRTDSLSAYPAIFDLQESTITTTS